MRNKIKNMKKIISGLFLVLALSVSTPVSAELIDTFRDWSAFVEAEGANKVCFMASAPKKSKGKYTKRGDVNFMVTHRPSEKTRNVVNMDAGYAFRKDSEVTVTIASREFRMFTDGGFAWAYDSKTDQALVKAMRAGSKMVARGVSSRGTKTTDIYSLSGFIAAHNAINKACGVK